MPFSLLHAKNRKSLDGNQKIKKKLELILYFLRAIEKNLSESYDFFSIARKK
jgi:hypothetical protein